MRYCAHCGVEYGEETEGCATCPTAELLSPAELQQRQEAARLRLRELDTRSFQRAGTTDDPLSADLISRVLDAASIPVFASDPRGGTVDPLTTGMLHDWWEFWVPEADLARATELVALAKARLAATADEAARAAEEEELETERQVRPVPQEPPAVRE